MDYEMMLYEKIKTLNLSISERSAALAVFETQEEIGMERSQAIEIAIKAVLSLRQ